MLHFNIDPGVLVVKISIRRFTNQNVPTCCLILLVAKILIEAKDEQVLTISDL